MSRDENEPGRIDPRLIGLPSGPAPGNIGTISLSGDGGFF
jgi:hypothetical protein